MASRGEKRREARAKGSEMSKFYWVLGAVAVVGVAIVGYSVGSNALGAAATEPIDMSSIEQGQLVEIAQGITKGDEDAPLTIVEFADYQCPGCGAFALSVKPQVELAYVQTGKAKFVYYDFPLISIHAHAFLAARAARCADDQELFWQYQDVLFRNQPSWSTKTDVTRDFIDYAETVGAEPEAFEACLRSDRHADVVSANLRLAQELGLDGTPTIMVSQGQGMARRLNAFDFQSIQAVVDPMLEALSDPGS